MREFRRLAIVNRGEAAMRCLHAVADLDRGTDDGLRTIALYTDPDRASRFVRAADEAVSLGSATFVDPADGRRKHRYLDLDLLERTLESCGAEAVWPGWGFVAESADFADRCARRGIVFVGPDGGVMRRLGDKIASKRLAQEADVPVVPWSGGPVHAAADGIEAARSLGYPLLVKATAGGGGRGIRLVRGEGDLPGALAEAQAEARLAFGDERVFLEQMVSGARHVEVQVIADRHGTAWAVGVRDCSVQRRNQKVVEESASSLLDDATERGLRETAVRLCRAAGYHGAGTVEYLLLPDGRFLFMEVNARLQVEHPVTELVTGVDLVGLQLHVARGGRLEGEPPGSRGHAIEVRLNAEDPDADFAPAPGRLVLFRAPSGAGVRVDSGVGAGDVVAPEFDSMIAKILAWGRDRPEALARMRRALTECSVVVDGGMTNKAFLLELLRRPELVGGSVDTGWLDALTATGEHRTERFADAALVVAAVEAYDVEGAVDQARFFATAARGRPEVGDESEHTVDLRHRGVVHPTRVWRLGPRRYRVAVGERAVDVEVDHLGPHDRRVRIGEVTYRAVSVVHAGVHAVEVEGVPHKIVRDEGGVLRAPAPAVVVSIHVRPGDTVDVGDPLVVVESMKMELTLTAPVTGRVRTVDAIANRQVPAGAPLVTVEPDEPATDTPVGDAIVLDVADRPTPRAPGERCDLVFEDLRSQLLGYDADRADRAAAARARAEVSRLLDPDDHRLLERERALLALFAHLAGLSRRQPDPRAEDADGERSAQEYLWTFLRSPDRGGRDVPPGFRERLRHALAHYGVDGLERTRELDEALYWMFRAHGRLGEHAPVVEAVLDRHLAHLDVLLSLADEAWREVLDGLVHATEGRFQTVCDLARDVRYAFFDRPLLEETSRRVYDDMARHLEALAGEPDADERVARMRALVECPLTLHARFMTWLGGPDPTRRAVVLEALARRYYRIRGLEHVTVVDVDDAPVLRAEYDHEGARVRLLAVAGPYEHLRELVGRVAVAQRDVPRDRDVVVDCYLAGPSGADTETTERAVRDVLDAATFDRPLRRVVVSVARPPLGPVAPSSVSFTYRPRPDGTYVEESLTRNIHPMLAKRMELWRLRAFDLERVPTVEDVYLFRGVARENPRDERLFALAEVRDLTPVRDEHGRVTALPHLERMLTESLSSIRWFQAHRPARSRLVWNRIVLFVHPTWTIAPDEWSDIAHRLGPATRGLGIERVVLVVRRPAAASDDAGRSDEPTESTVIEHSAPAGRGLVIRYRALTDRPIEPLSEYHQRVVLTQRRGNVYPYELVALLASPADARTQSDFPPGSFTELDLDDDGRLVPTDRPPGGNTANVVVGLVRNETAKHPEGMERVILLGDPSRSLGALAEPECRRIIAALDVAEERRIPLEWFALSSGARIAMDTGTENMDWIAAVLRRLIEFTQRGGEVNVVVTGINVGAQPYWNAEATMLMHTRGILVMLPESAMVLTGKQSLDYSGGVSAEDNLGIGGYERVMGPNGQAQYRVPDVGAACQLLLRHYEHTYVVPGERFPRRATTTDAFDRDVRDAPHARVEGTEFTLVGDVFSDERNPERKKPFDIRSVMRAVADADHEPLERWTRMHAADTSVVWDAHVGGVPVCMLGFESRVIPRTRFVPADGPSAWTSGTLFPQSSKKTARAVNAASGNRPLVVLANLSGFDGSPESMRGLQLEFGAEIGRAITNFDGPIVFVVVSRYHGGAFVVFSKRLNEQVEVAAVEGSYASVIGGAPAAAVVFAREVDARTDADPRVTELRARLDAAPEEEQPALRRELDERREQVRSEKLGEVAEEFDTVHSIHRAHRVGSVDAIIEAARLRPWIIDALERGMARREPPPTRDPAP